MLAHTSELLELGETLTSLRKLKPKLPATPPMSDETKAIYAETQKNYGFDPKAEELDLQLALAERLVLIVPSNALCREGCAGLCEHCGANLNEGDCGCAPAETDPRWGPLQELRSETRE